MKKLRAILIDPFTRTVTKHEIEDGIDAIYKLGQYECFECVELPNGDMMFVDDEGYYKGHQEAEDGWKRGFVVADKGYVGGISPELVGRAIILGTNRRTGNSMDCKTEVHELSIAWFKTDRSI